jgi:hypothetical protein
VLEACKDIADSLKPDRAKDAYFCQHLVGRAESLLKELSKPNVGVIRDNTEEIICAIEDFFLLNSTSIYDIKKSAAYQQYEKIIKLEKSIAEKSFCVHDILRTTLNAAKELNIYEYAVESVDDELRNALETIELLHCVKLKIEAGRGYPLYGQPKYERKPEPYPYSYRSVDPIHGGPCCPMRTDFNAEICDSDITDINAALQIIWGAIVQLDPSKEQQRAELYPIVWQEICEIFKPMTAD